MKAGRRRSTDEISATQFRVIGANIRTLRMRKGWSQARLGELMGWGTASNVCAAEGRRGGRQRGFTSEEVERLASIFGVPAWRLTTQCANCGGRPPAGFACLTCGAHLKTAVAMGSNPDDPGGMQIEEVGLDVLLTRAEQRI